MSEKKPKDVRMGSLINAAIEEFLEKGYEGASIDAIAKRAGVSKGGLYHHFSNKEELMLAVNIKLSEPVYEMIEKACSNQHALEGLRQYIRDYLYYWAERPRELGFFFMSTSKAFESAVLMDYYRQYMNEYTALMTGLFKKAIDSGETGIDDPEAYGLALIGTLDGVLSYVITGSQADITALAERVCKVLLR